VLDRFTERDRIEAQSHDFHVRVRQAFLELAAAEPQHYLVIDATQDRDEIAAQIRARLQPILPKVDL
jgi:dTMP kinase